MMAGFQDGQQFQQQMLPKPQFRNMRQPLPGAFQQSGNIIESGSIDGKLVQQQHYVYKPQESLGKPSVISLEPLPVK